MKLNKPLKIFFFITLFCFTYYLKSQENNKSALFTFSGDFMAHTNVTRMKDFSIIFEDIKCFTLTDDLTFTNIETPVNKDKDYSNYPAFNVKPDYPLTAIEAGFQVFSLANNHTNDIGSSGVDATYDFFKSIEKDNVYAAGIRESETSPLSYQVINVNGLKVLFIAITEICNHYGAIERIDLRRPTKEIREKFLQEIKTLRENNPCDVFIASIHVAEPEYVIPVTQERKDYFHQILSSGVDIIWANHPHVLQEWEVLTDKNGNKRKLIMYSLGNLVSGQRMQPNFEDPNHYREYTGDSVLMRVRVSKQGFKPLAIESVNAIPITTHIDTNKQTHIMRFTNEFIDKQDAKLKEYYLKRKEYMNKIQGTQYDYEAF